MKLTSKLNFSITKKRLLMMSKNSPFIQRFGKVLPLVPLLFFIGLMFCDRTVTDADLYPDVKLKLLKSPYEQTLGGGVLDRRMYDSKGNLFTGTQNYYRKENNKLYSSFTYREGVLLLQKAFDESGNELHRVEEEYDFEQSKRVSMRMFDHGFLTVEIQDSSPEHNNMHVFREWHSNGQLKFEMTSDSLGTQGLMTLYDEQGQILEQELYKDGQMIEKIK
ncbi:MAG: hypothetical protein ED557_10330 [Balneola sp.]|nr:MAG: hypothetical protein ED557_10330 [Balneola sp.]